MERPEKRLPDGSKLYFARGKFDDWQVRCREWNGREWAPKDGDYLSDLAALGRKYGAGRVYGDFCALYDRTGAVPEADVLDLAAALAKRYGRDAERAEYLFSVLYMTMAAEENKAGTVLGRRIKRLAVHQVLLEGMNAWEAAKFSRGKNAAELSGACAERGF